MLIEEHRRQKELKKSRKEVPEKLGWSQERGEEINLL
jgi:hypothetical protein